MTCASIPSPSEGVVHLGPLPLRGYALCIALGIVVAVLLAERRMRARGAPEGTAVDLAILRRCRSASSAPGSTTSSPRRIRTSARAATPSRRSTSGAAASGSGAAIAGGVLGAWLVAAAPRDPAQHRGGRAGADPAGGAGHRALGQLVQPGALRPAERPAVGVAHRPGSPASWATRTSRRISRRSSTNRSGASASPLLCLWADKRFRLGGGRVFALYVAAYTAGRGWIESLRIDTAHRFFGLRLNDYVSIVVFLLAGVLPDPRSKPAEAASPAAPP